MKIVIASVVYKAAMVYMDDFLRSIREQTDQNFSLLLINDDIPGDELDNLIQRYFLQSRQDVYIIKAKEKASVSQLRIQMLLEAKQLGFHIMISADCDDKMSSNRVACYRKALEHPYSFYYNELAGFDGQAIMSGLPSETISWKQIEEENYLGMSNTGILLEDFSLDFLHSLDKGDVRIFDWYLFSRILLAGKKGKKVEGCSTYYRIHGNNIAGISVVSQERAVKEIDIKIEHYKRLEEEAPHYGELRQYYESLKEKKKKLIFEENTGFWWGLIKRERQ